MLLRFAKGGWGFFKFSKKEKSPVRWLCSVAGVRVNRINKTENRACERNEPTINNIKDIKGGKFNHCLPTGQLSCFSQNLFKGISRLVAYSVGHFGPLPLYHKFMKLRCEPAGEPLVKHFNINDRKEWNRRLAETGVIGRLKIDEDGHVIPYLDKVRPSDILEI